MSSVDQQQIDRVADLLPRLSRVMLMSMMGLAEKVAEERPGLAYSKAHIKALMLLYRRGPSPVGEIAEWLHVAAPTASEHIDRMTEAGLVERGVNPDDRRQVLVRLTTRGEDLISPCADYLELRIRSALEQFDADERQIVTRSLEAFATAFEAEVATGDRCPFSSN